jgi:predicted nucleic acid-binding protein
VRSTVDCLIAQLVIDHAGLLLYEDGDFERIREIRPLRTLRD